MCFTEVCASRWIDAGYERDKLKKMDIHVGEIKSIALVVKRYDRSGIKNGEEIEKRKLRNKMTRKEKKGMNIKRI